MRHSSLLVIIFLFANEIAKSQSSGIGVLAKTVYVNVKMPITFNMGCSPINKIKYQVSNGRIEQNGNEIFLIAEHKGDVEVKVLDENKTIAVANFKAKEMPPFQITIGENWSKSISTTMLKLETGLKCTVPDFLHEDDYKIISATVYLSGTGFENVSVASINEGSFRSLYAVLARCEEGTIITFENIKVEGPDGIRIAEGLTIKVTEF